MRRLAAALLAVLCVAGLLSVSVGTAGYASGGTDHAADPTASRGVEVDPRLGRTKCNLTGRLWVNGCARHRCIPPGTMFKEGFDAELCRLPGKQGAEYARAIDSRRCAALNRVWIGEINSCASNPNRARAVITHSSRCTGAATTYVNHREEEGYYDECLTPHRVADLRRIAKRKHVSLGAAALDRSRVNCRDRPATVMHRGLCVDREGPPPESALGGLLVVGDSVSWRGDNELAALRPDWHLDLRPGRRLDELEGRLDLFRANHGNPDALVIQLGTNRRKGFTEEDFRDVIATVPATTPVVFLLPYRTFNGDNEGPVNATKKYGDWMRSLAAVRPHTCLSDWPGYASKHLENLVDGEHPDSTHETWYARFLIRSWDSCSA